MYNLSVSKLCNLTGYIERILYQLFERALYCDTDSVVFVTNTGEWKPPLGDYLGDLTDETPNNAITHFVTGDPNNYAYNLLKPNKKGQTSVCKVRGITLNYRNLLDINFETISKMVCAKTSDSVIKWPLTVKVVDEHKRCRDRRSGNIITKTEAKDYKIVFDRRVITASFKLLSYGN